MIRRILFIICLSFYTQGFSQSASGIGTGEGANDPKDSISTSISIFPNPATHYFKVTDNDNIKELVVTDLLGKTVKTFRYGADTQYDVQDLRKGMYLIQIISKDQKIIKIQRLIKNQP